ncbi:hypothetical protein FMM80_07725 [Schaedlerella arabinosiphila]|uniref:Uncharacterized protein n=1 Tax=Schaedlerella arabinosiphila TaxID=2044587 RepID=A0A9X5C5V0_9FIRM|nr:hypothetical protein [Schaedlerella arabinosiphila]NDO68580.1 hypothetical protein [Schaedlerella arabinosiphila]
MNKVWSELNKTMQTQIKKKDTYKAGIDTLIHLRNQLMETLTSFNEKLSREDFDAIPFINADGYHSKTIAYSIWLIDYWCGKDIRGLIQMPFSRHWIMHIEASLRIKNKIHS